MTDKTEDRDQENKEFLLKIMFYYQAQLDGLERRNSEITAISWLHREISWLQERIDYVEPA